MDGPENTFNNLEPPVANKGNPGYLSKEALNALNADIQPSRPRAGTGLTNTSFVTASQGNSKTSGNATLKEIRANFKAGQYNTGNNSNNSSVTSKSNNPNNPFNQMN